MSGNRVSDALGIVCIALAIFHIFFIVVPYQRDEMILEGSDFDIAENLTVPFHASFPLRSYDQSVDISIACANGSLDIVVLKSTEWNAWNGGGNYSALYETTNVTSVMTTLEINPPYFGSIDIILQTNYGDVWMAVSTVSHSMDYNNSVASLSLGASIVFALLWICSTNKMPKSP
jgi:hypothetical protein